MYRFTFCSLFLLVLIFGFELTAGELSPAILIAEGDVSQAQIIVGAGVSAILTFVQDGHAQICLNPVLPSLPIVVTEGALLAANPQVHLSASGVLTTIYDRQHDAPGALGNEIYYRQFVSGGFGPQVNISANLAMDRNPRIVTGAALGSRHAAWNRGPLGAAEIIWSENLASSEIVASGEAFDIWVEGPDRRHLIYARDNRIYYKEDLGMGFGSELALSTFGAVANYPSLALDAAGNLHISYLEDGDVIYRRRDVGLAFQPAIEVTSDANLDTPLELQMSPSGFAILYASDGDLWKVFGVGTILLPPENLTNTPEVESEPSFALDMNGNLHISYVRNSAVYYQNDIAEPIPQFAFDPSQGLVPLTVEFENSSQGDIDSYFWDFGDGNVSSEQNPIHIYDQVGAYTVSLTVSGPGGLSELVMENAIQVADPSNFMRVAPVLAFRNQTNVHVPILGTNSDGAQGYQLVVQWPCEIGEFVEFTEVVTIAETLFPEFLQSSVDLDNCQATMGLLLDFQAPFDGRLLLPGVDQRLGNLVLNIPGNAPLGNHLIELVNNVGSPPLNNIFVVEGVSVLPILSAGVIEIVPLTIPLTGIFLRGDFDQTGAVDVTDAVLLLAYLFADGFSPNCLDAADTNDNGIVDISDPIFVLTYLFNFGQVLPYPFPNFGFDPTEDSLPGC